MRYALVRFPRRNRHTGAWSALVIPLLLSIAVAPVAANDDGDSAPPISTPNGPMAASETEVEHHANGRVKIEREVQRTPEGKLIHHGSWKWWDSSGVLMAAGQFERGQRQGPWRRLHFREEGGVFQEPPFTEFESPYSSEALFTDGKLDGLWTMRDARGRPITSIAYRRGQRHGTAHWWYANGTRLQQIDYRDGIIDGEVVKWSITGEEMFRRGFVDGRELLVAATNYPQGQRRSAITLLTAPLVAEGEDDWWTGQRTLYRPQGQDARQGIAIQWYPNGQTQRHGDFDRDLPVSTHTWWHVNGIKAAQGDYRLGQPHGVWSWWHSNGRDAVVGAFDNGVPVGDWTWRSGDGTLIGHGTPIGYDPYTVADRDAVPVPPAAPRTVRAARAP